MQDIFTLLLIAVLAVSVVSFVVMGLRQLRRTNSLGRKAHEMGLHFSPSDLFDVPRRYGDFALISKGHGPRAYNLTHGRLGRLPLRAFDFRYEVGHATRRLTRHYSVIVARAGVELGRVVMWSLDDAQAAPLSAGTLAGRVANWACCGDLQLARIMARACQELSEQAVSIEARDDTVMFCIPVTAPRRDYIGSIEHVNGVMQRLIEHCREDQ